ncbi:MAG: sugar phosphate isomerase/epimerase family protein [Trueperaceae bacterium]
MLPIGLQVYSVRDALAKDFAGTLTTLAKRGYAGVELFGDLPNNTKKIVTDLGLEIPGKHAAHSDLRENAQKYIDECLELDISVLICAWSMTNETFTWESITEDLENIAQQAQKHNLTFAYHNHAHELLQKVGNQTVLDYMATNAPTLKFELDVAWLYAGGVDPSAYLETYAERTVLVHIKDVRKAAKGWDTVELGQGTVPLGNSLASAKKTKSPWLIIEQDNSDDPMRSAKNNLEWLRNYQSAQD